MDNGIMKWINQVLDQCMGSYDNIIGEDWLEFHKSKVDYNRE
jgi:hypothetical protein